MSDAATVAVLVQLAIAVIAFVYATVMAIYCQWFKDYSNDPRKKWFR